MRQELALAQCLWSKKLYVGGLRCRRKCSGHTGRDKKSLLIARMVPPGGPGLTCLSCQRLDPSVFLCSATIRSRRRIPTPFPAPCLFDPSANLSSAGVLLFKDSSASSSSFLFNDGAGSQRSPLLRLHPIPSLGSGAIISPPLQRWRRIILSLLLFITAWS